MTPPFRCDEEGRIKDGNGDVVGDSYDGEEFGQLICGLLNGHFGVPVVFHAEPIEIGRGEYLEIKQV